jgi:alkanesulfonate monooxygenase SsuD/methylene tetrahydromethanopterin reductase-like flavin-dependent oxidoreductase (luciferase family)
MLPNSGAVDDGGYAVVEAARQAEELGFGSVWCVDHLAFHSGVLEPVVTLAAAAAVTGRVRLGFGVLLAALRHPALLAKQLGSLQTLSGDRLDLGVGVGGENPDEWAAAGVPVTERGRRTDRLLEVLPGLIRGVPAELPAPWHDRVPALSPDGAAPPVWIGGSSAAAMERVLRHGDGWLGLWAGPEAVGRRRRELLAAAEARGRPAPRIGVTVFVHVDDQDPAGARAEAGRFLERQYRLAPALARRFVLAGDGATVARGLAGYLDAGADQLVLFPAATSYTEQYRRLADWALPLIEPGVSRAAA